MDIEVLDVAGFSSALHAMRNPMNSWSKSDSVYVMEFGELNVQVGEADKDLSLRLQKAGPEHCKHLRMIVAWMNIKAPLTWWKQFDCYRAGVEKVSTSTMHKLMSRELTTDDFQEVGDDCYTDHLYTTIRYINQKMREYNTETNAEKKRLLWECVIQNLPQSYLQRRTVMMSYAAIRNIVKQREGHKLHEWQQFIDACKNLPESWMIFE